MSGGSGGAEKDGKEINAKAVWERTALDFLSVFERPLLIINHTAPPSGPLTTDDNSRHADSVPARLADISLELQQRKRVFFAEPIKPQLEEISVRAPTRSPVLNDRVPFPRKNHVEEPNRPLLLLPS